MHAMQLLIVSCSLLSRFLIVECGKVCFGGLTEVRLWSTREKMKKWNLKHGKMSQITLN